MMNSVRNALCFAALATFVASGLGQYPPPAPYPYYPPPGYGGFGPGNVLNGQANVMNATGNLYVAQEQSKVEREAANQAKIETKRKAFDEMMYEKANTPTFTETQEKTDMMIVRRVLNHPTQAEITTGQAQNILLPYLDKLMRTGIQGPPVAIDQNSLKFLNVTVGKGGGNIGLLKNGGKLDWPIGCLGPTQKSLDPLFPKLVYSASTGNLDVATYTKCSNGVQALQDEVKNKFMKDQLDGGMYLESKRYLDSLTSSLQMIRSPSANKLLNGDYAAVGRTVPELVYNMMSKGLMFAPATPGVEAPYYALQNALTSFAAGAENSPAFRVTFDPFIQPAKKDFSK
jgi:hypothetical protein